MLYSSPRPPSSLSSPRREASRVFPGQGAVHRRVTSVAGLQEQSAEPLTLAGYAAGPQVEVYLEHVAVGAALPEMPLFPRPDRYIYVPLEAT